MSNEKLTRVDVANVGVYPKLILMNHTGIIRLKIKGGCLKQEDTAPFAPKQFHRCLWIRQMVERLKYWFLSKRLLVWSC